ncbi:MAG: hypothetical protein QM497_05135 [Sulfurimonas sp.]
MQRKNGFLMRSKSKNGIAMIMAIAVIVILATIIALSLSLTTTTTKKTTDTYLYEQAILLSQSAADYAMLEMSIVAPCSKDNIAPFSYNNGLFDVDISVLTYMSYPGTSCDGNVTVALKTPITDPQSDGTVVLDITVSSDAGTEPIRYFRRTIQKL